MSLVSVCGRNWCYSCGGIERVERIEIVELASIDAVSMHIAENMAGCQKRLGEYPTNLRQAKALLRAARDPAK